VNQFALWLASTPPSVFIQEHNAWAIPAIQSVHIVGIALVMGSVLMIDLRILGLAWTDRTLQQTTRRHGAASFDRELLRAHRIDRMIKGIETGDPWDSVIELALGIAGKSVLAAA